MSRNRADSWIPAVIRTALDLPPLWGRLAWLSPSGAELVSHFEFPAGKTLALSFSLGRAGFTDVRGRITKALRDSDGYWNYSLSFLDKEQSDRLRAAIAEASR